MFIGSQVLRVLRCFLQNLLAQEVSEWIRRTAPTHTDIFMAQSIQLGPWKRGPHTTVGEGVQCLCPNSPETPPIIFLGPLQPRRAPPARPHRSLLLRCKHAQAASRPHGACADSVGMGLTRSTGRSGTKGREKGWPPALWDFPPLILTSSPVHMM